MDFAGLASKKPCGSGGGALAAEAAALAALFCSLIRFCSSMSCCSLELSLYFLEVEAEVVFPPVLTFCINFRRSACATTDFLDMVNITAASRATDGFSSLQTARPT